MRIVSSVLASMMLLSVPLVLLAEEEVEGEGLKTLAVQNRLHTQTHEFTAWVGSLPLDAFEKGLTFTGAYSIHFSDFLAWEVAQFTYSHRIEMDLKEELLDVCSATTTPFETVHYYLTTGLVLKPLYGKLAFFNRTLIYGEMFVALGGGYGWMTLTSRPVGFAGGGVRMYVGKYLSFRLDLRDVMFINLDDLHNELWIALGIALAFG